MIYYIRYCKFCQVKVDIFVVNVYNTSNRVFRDPNGDRYVGNGKPLPSF